MTPTLVSPGNTSAPELLRIEDLHAWYGESHILHGVNLSVNEGEVVTLLGRNGAGRTTTMRAIVGLTGSRKGKQTILAIYFTTYIYTKRTPPDFTFFNPHKTSFL